MEEQKLVYAFLDTHIGIDSFDDYDSKDDIIEYAVELVGEEDRLTMGCGVGPLMGYINSWVDHFEQDSKASVTYKYEQKLIQQLSNNNLVSDNLTVLATYVYSKEGQKELLDQAYKQMTEQEFSVKQIYFTLEDFNKNKDMLEIIKGLDQKSLSFLNSYINTEFKTILNEKLDHLEKAVTYTYDLKDIQVDTKKFKM